MARTNNNGTFEYPKKSWSVGKMRKNGDTQFDQTEDRPKLAMLGFGTKPRRGEALEWGGAEIERAAGIQMSARGQVTRGAGGRSPDVIQQEKSMTQAPGQQYEMGTLNFRKLEKRRERFEKAAGMSVVDVLDAMTMPVELATGFSVSDAFVKAGEKLVQRDLENAKAKGETHIEGIDDKGQLRMLPLGEIDPAIQGARILDAAARLLIGKVPSRAQEQVQWGYEE